jgi:hypothetical protein
MERQRNEHLERMRPLPKVDERLVEREVLAPRGKLTDAEAIEIATDAYVYAYPMVLMDVTRAVSTNVMAPDPTRLEAPMNQIVHAAAFPDATFTNVVRPNADTLYSLLWFDVSKEPLVLSVPESGGRFYLLPMLDLWTDVFASPGARTTGTAAQRFAIVAPQWSGRLPHGVEPLRAPTAVGWMIGRTQTNGTADYDAVHAFQAGIYVAPLSAMGTRHQPRIAPVDPAVSPMPPVDQVARMEAFIFFSRFTALASQNPPHANDSPILQRIRHLGIVPGVRFAPERASPNAIDALDQAVALGQRKIRAHGLRSAHRVNGWSTGSGPVGTYGTDYLQRASIAMMGLGANTTDDAVYLTAHAMADGSPFDSAGRYELRFSGQDLPPARAFWSLTLYDDRLLFADNPLDRYALGDRDPLRAAEDGSLTIHIQRTWPGEGHNANWLPAPRSGGFSLTLRLYWPAARALDGRWEPPVVRRVG